MPYGICDLSAIPMRSEPSDKAEMVNQILFGEAYTLLEQNAKWCRVQLHHDQYEGWIDRKQVNPCRAEFIESLKPSSLPVAQELIELVSEEATASFYPVFLGSYLPFFKDGKLKIDHREFEYQGTASRKTAGRAELVATARQYLHAPYLWGGRTPFGLDCSGFTQMVYRLAGHDLPRDAHQQAEQGLHLSFIEEAQPGDLAFFDNEEGRITHVGILLPDQYIIHASGKVRLDRLDHSGIFQKESGKHTHKLRVIKRIM